MNFSFNKQSGFVMPALWIAVLIGFLSVTALKNNEIPDIENPENIQQVDLNNDIQEEAVTLSNTDEE